METSTSAIVSQPPRVCNLSSEPPEGLAELQASLDRLEVPTVFRYSLQDHLTDGEKSKLLLFAAVKKGLTDAAAVLSPKRFGRWYDDKLHTESNLWLRALWGENVSVKQAERAFELHLRCGRKFPSPAQILALVKDEPSR